MDTRQVLILARGSLIFLGLMFLFDERWEQPRVGDRVFLCIILDNYCAYGLNPRKVRRKAIPMERKLGLMLGDDPDSIAALEWHAGDFADHLCLVHTRALESLNV